MGCVFSKVCHAYSYTENDFFEEWHSIIINDYERFKGILKKYNDSVAKTNLIAKIEYIQKNIKNLPSFNLYSDTKYYSLESTPNYFMFSFYEKSQEEASYVLFSKDYKKFLFAKEEDAYGEDEDRKGTYLYEYYFLEGNEVINVSESIYEYATDYESRFTYPTGVSLELSEKTYKELLKKQNMY